MANAVQNAVALAEALANGQVVTKTDWRAAENLPPDSRWVAPTTDQGVSTLFRWGVTEWKVQPFNVHEIDHETGTDWAHKEIAGAAIYREWVGENDETIYMRGRLFPYRIGGMSQLEHFEAQRRAGIVNMLIRGDGTVLGWFVVEKLVRAHTFPSAEGVGQQITFEATFQRVPAPAQDEYFSSFWRTSGAAA